MPRSTNARPRRSRAANAAATSVLTRAASSCQPMSWTLGGGPPGVHLAQLDEYVIDRISHRVRAAVASPSTAYLEYGHPNPSCPRTTSKLNDLSESRQVGIIELVRRSPAAKWTTPDVTPATSLTR